MTIIITTCIVQLSACGQTFSLTFALSPGLPVLKRTELSLCYLRLALSYALHTDLTCLAL